MTDFPKYLIVGRGRWASRMHVILTGEGRPVCSFDQSRRFPSEDQSAYQDRLLSSFKTSSAQFVWLCVPPGDHIPVMIEAAVKAGLHVVVEKPWFCSTEETNRLTSFGRAHHAVLAIHYEYCLLEKVESWRLAHGGGAALGFSGRLNVQRANHLGLPALDNLGSHLFSIQEYSVPNSTIGDVECAYGRTDERRVWLAKENTHIDEIDLLANKEPIIQRFIARVEAAARGADFPFDLQFALRVAERIARWRQSHLSERR